MASASGAFGPLAPAIEPMTNFLVQGSPLRGLFLCPGSTPTAACSHARAGCPLLPSRCALPGSEPRGGAPFRRVQCGCAPSCGPRPGGFFRKVPFSCQFRATAPIMEVFARLSVRYELDEQSF